MTEDFMVLTWMLNAGYLIAVILSWRRNHSMMWLMLHGLLGWVYVIYFILSGSSKIDETKNREQKDREFKKMVADLVQQQKDSKNPGQHPPSESITR